MKKRDPYLAMSGITLSFGPVRVLRAADLSVERGQIHALLGENGAGKSSLMKVLFGRYAHSRGTIRLDGHEVRIPSPATARAHGLAFIHQELPFARHLSVAQNLFLGRELRKGPFGFIDERRQNEAVRALLAPYPIQVDPRTPVRHLSLAQQQIVAIAGALGSGADLVILDEATTALTEAESERLFVLLEQFAAEGKTFVMITHRLEEVFRVSTDVTVMRDGETVATFRTREVSAQRLVKAMVGREVEDVFPHRRPTRVLIQGAPRLSVRDLRTRKLRGISFDLYPGEVVGVGGLMGAGRTSLFNALFGVDRLLAGAVLIDGSQARLRGPRDAMAHGMAYITEDRKSNGLALLRSVEENIGLAQIERHTRCGLVDDRALNAISRKFSEKLSIDARVSRRVGLLSGGNQQKIVLAKWLATGADIILLDEPTRGVDVGTKLEVYALIRSLTDQGKSVLLATSELPELLAMSDRLIVLSDGVLVRELAGDSATPENIVYYASTNVRDRSGSTVRQATT